MADNRMLFKIIIVAVGGLTSLRMVQAAPATPPSEGSQQNCTDAEPPEQYEMIDQSQNGTENYRINVKDVVFIWAPAEALFAATALLDTQLLGEDFLGTVGDAGAEKPQVSIGDVGENKPPVETSSTAQPATSENDHGPINPTSKPAHLRSMLRKAIGGPFLKSLI